MYMFSNSFVSFEKRNNDILILISRLFEIPFGSFDRPYMRKIFLHFSRGVMAGVPGHDIDEVEADFSRESRGRHSRKYDDNATRRDAMRSILSKNLIPAAAGIA